jgi:aspartate aminotransferase
MKLDHEYLPIEGLQRFTDSAARLMLGSFAAEGKHAAVQSISGTGGVRYGAELLNRFPPKAGKVVYISKPTWGNHKNIFQDAGFEVKEYKYWNASTNGLDLAGMLNDIKSAPEGSVILLHACAHNPTGVDPTEDQWNQILSVIRDKNHLTFFDSAYQGFASGNVDKDAFSVRLWCKEQIPFVLAMSFSKNFGLYNERCGVTIVYCPGANGKIEAENIRSQLARIARPMISNPPAHGARIVDIVLNSDELHKEW